MKQVYEIDNLDKKKKNWRLDKVIIYRIVIHPESVVSNPQSKIFSGKFFFIITNRYFKKLKKNLILD